MSLYLKYRPKKLADVRGQEEAVKVLGGKLANGNDGLHAVLLSGPSGCGKTTIARILKDAVDCGDGDFLEVNAADFRGIDNIRDIRRQMNLAPMFGGSRVYLLDEAHKLSNDAQNALLKTLEDTPSHVYFFLATTDPQNLIPTVVNRCLPVQVRPLAPKVLRSLLEEVAAKERVGVDERVLRRIVEVAEGSPRRALVFLDSILPIEDVEEQIACILPDAVKQQAEGLVKLLCNDRTKWDEVRVLLKEVAESEAETVRRRVLAYASAILLNKDSGRAYFVLTVFAEPFFHTGKPGLVRACYEVFSHGK